MGINSGGCSGVITVDGGDDNNGGRWGGDDGEWYWWMSLTNSSGQHFIGLYVAYV